MRHIERARQALAARISAEATTIVAQARTCCPAEIGDITQMCSAGLEQHRDEWIMQIASPSRWQGEERGNHGRHE